MLEQGYLCWHEGQTERDAKEVKAASMEEAAQTAVDIWRHESLKELGHNKVTVYVKDIDENEKSFTITGSGDGDASKTLH